MVALPTALAAGDWSELQQLEVIRLDQNNIGGELPPSWGKLTNLRTLTFWDNKLEGEIPDSWANMQASAAWLQQ
jgi:hypothetical protein